MNDLAEISVLKPFLVRHGFNPKKSLGQHWLASKSAADKIVSACTDAKGILEIGPGPGVLTQRLSTFAEVIALDLDSRCENALSEAAPDATFVLADVLEADLSALLRRLKTPRAIVSNLPYYITAAVLQRICDIADDIAFAVLMMQSEVAQRVAAVPGNSSRGSLSVLAQFFFRIEPVCSVPPSAFFPPPKVASQVLRFQTRRQREPFEGFFDFVRASFKQPRKTISNNIANAGIATREVVEAELEDLGVSRTARPHTLTEEQWLSLASRIYADGKLLP